MNTAIEVSRKHCSKYVDEENSLVREMFGNIESS